MLWCFWILIGVCIAVLQLWSAKCSTATPQVRGDVLLVFAHPDDEAMFFSPLLAYLRRRHTTVHFLCLSDGNFDGLGQVREKELLDSAAYYDVQRAHVKVVRHPDLQDGMKNVWDPQLVARVVLEYLKEKGTINTVVTFDEHGVSRHPNHIAVYRGVKEAKQSMPPGIIFLQLYSRGILGKYLGPLGVIHYLAGLSSLPKGHRNFVILTPPFQMLSSFNGMRNHRSQLVWFRYLFVFFSSYTYVNEYTEIQA